MTDHDRLALVRRALNLSAGWAEHRLAWLRTLLTDLRRSDWLYAADDPLEAAEAQGQSLELLDGLTAAFADEIDALAEAEQAALGEAPGPDDEMLPF